MRSGGALKAEAGAPKIDGPDDIRQAIAPLVSALVDRVGLFVTLSPPHVVRSVRSPKSKEPP